MVSQQTPDRTRAWHDVVVNYFEKCAVDYSRVWSGGNSLAMHMGYWDETTRSHAESLLGMNREMANRADVQGSDVVLDAGCGLGGTAHYLAETRGCTVLGITLPRYQAISGVAGAANRGLSHLVTFAQQDFHAIGVRDASVDVVWAQEALAHSADKQQFFREAYRVLRPGGRLVVEDGLRFRRPYSDAEELLLRSWLLGWAVPDLATGDEYVRWSEEVGFEEARVDDVTEGARRSLRRLNRLSTLFFPVAVARHPLRRLRAAVVQRAGAATKLAAMDPLGPDVAWLLADRRYRNIRGGRLQWRALQQELWFIGILSARKPGLS